VISVQEVQELTLRGPVLLAPDPFVPICLPPSIEILADGWDLARELDAPYPHRVRPVVLLSDTTPGGSRFGPPIAVKIPSPAAINAGLPTHRSYIQRAFLQQSTIAARIADEAQARHYETVVLLIVDGLSYSDLQEWPWPAIPCFVDGPSITMAGYPNVVGQPVLSRRLETVGLRKAIGFSYWDRSNLLTDTLFTGIPLQRVNHFPILIEQLAQIPLRGT
jgi:hypothetical protein